jgi:uncharacterized protein (DUF736 family)
LALALYGQNGLKASKNAPDYRVLTGTTEIGAAWMKTSAEGNPYLAVRLDDPSFPTFHRI